MAISPVGSGLTIPPQRMAAFITYRDSHHWNLLPVTGLADDMKCYSIGVFV